MNFMRQIALGNNLTRLANIVEEMERREGLLPIGVSGLGCWAGAEREKIVAEVEQRTAALSKVPRHLVTEAVAKNMILAFRMGRETRARAQSRLLDILVDAGVALPLEEFEKSYG